MCGMAIVGTPAAVAERTPVGESSIATQSRGSTPRRRGGREVGLRVRLAVADLVARDEDVEGALRQAAQTASTSDRHDIVTSADGTPASPSRSSSRAPGRHGTATLDPGDDAVEQARR